MGCISVFIMKTRSKFTMWILESFIIWNTMLALHTELIFTFHFVIFEFIRSIFDIQRGALANVLVPVAEPPFWYAEFHLKEGKCLWLLLSLSLLLVFYYYYNVDSIKLEWLYFFWLWFWVDKFFYLKPYEGFWKE